MAEIVTLTDSLVTWFHVVMVPWSNGGTSGQWEFYSTAKSTQTIPIFWTNLNHAYTPGLNIVKTNVFDNATIHHNISYVLRILKNLRNDCFLHYWHLCEESNGHWCTQRQLPQWKLLSFTNSLEIHDIHVMPTIQYSGWSGIQFDWYQFSV